MAARGERRPDDAVRVDVDAARIEARLGHLEDLRDARFRRILAALQPHEITRERLAHTPHRVVYRARDHRIEREAHLRIELWIERAILPLPAGSGTPRG